MNCSIRFACCMLPLVFTSAGLAAGGPEVIDPQESQRDPDFAIQGEYLGEGVLPDGNHGKAGAQVVARGEGEFTIELFTGGLPGAGWQRGDKQFSLSAKRGGEEATLSGQDLNGRIDGQTLTLCNAQGKTLLKLARIERASPTLGEKPPAGATVIFDGRNAEDFKDGNLTDMGTLEAGCTTKQTYPMKRLHLEFRLSWKPEARGQGRSNSGVYITGVPEIQVLDSFGLEGKNNECGGLYGRQEPGVNMCLPPLVWQTYDVEFLAPDKDKNDRVVVNVLHNGVLVHEGYAVRGKLDEPRGIHLQRHGNRVQYRNIWVVPD